MLVIGCEVLLLSAGPYHFFLTWAHFDVVRTVKPTSPRCLYVFITATVYSHVFRFVRHFPRGTDAHCEQALFHLALLARFPYFFF